MDTLLYDISIPAISSLQSSLLNQAPFMQLMSTVFDPKYAFLIYSPLAYLLNAKVGKQLIMTTVLAEWINMILKWFLHGERPYWYVHSSGRHDAQATPIKQFPITCELGPGHPSGHAMVTAAVWYVILSSLLELYQNHNQLGQGPKTTATRATTTTTTTTTTTMRTLTINRSVQTLATWTLYATLVTLVSLSRVFLGCHFPHQCLAGGALGLLVAKWISSQENIRARHFVSASIVLLSTAFGTFSLLQAFGLDPSWTIKLASHHCEKREYIHLDTAPFFSVMRYSGFALGCGLGLAFPISRLGEQFASAAKKLISAVQVGSFVMGEEETRELLATKTTDDKRRVEQASAEVEALKNPFSSRNISWLSFRLISALLMARLVDNLGLFVSHSNLTAFYACAFVAYTLFSYAFVNL